MSGYHTCPDFIDYGDREYARGKAAGFIEAITSPQRRRGRVWDCWQGVVLLALLAGTAREPGAPWWLAAILTYPLAAMQIGLIILAWLMEREAQIGRGPE